MPWWCALEYPCLSNGIHVQWNRGVLKLHNSGKAPVVLIQVLGCLYLDSCDSLLLASGKANQSSDDALPIHEPLPVTLNAYDNYKQIKTGAVLLIDDDTIVCSKVSLQLCSVR